MKIKNILLTILLISGLMQNVFATHNRAGEITFVQTGSYTFDFTIVIFTYKYSEADRPTIPVIWGDGTVSEVPRYAKIQGLPNNYVKNVYKYSHTYPGAGVYTVLVEDPNRNLGVSNIPNSVNTIFSVTTTIIINSFIGYNSSPILLNPPYDRAGLGRLFIHNPAAYDPDGDLLTYNLTVCTQEGGQPILYYTLPKASKSFTVDSISGDMIWDVPIEIGDYNVAMEVKEWRSGVNIGTIRRDLQISVFDSENNPPENGVINDICIVEGDTVDILLTAIDDDLDELSMFAYGGIFATTASPATLSTIKSERGLIKARLYWESLCQHVRKEPYQITIKTEDNYPDFNLFDSDNFRIRVLGKPVQGITTYASSNAITLRWEPKDCSNVKGYRIYRKENSYTAQMDSCSWGVPEEWGYSEVANVDKYSTTYVDNNKGAGLMKGTQYCYRIVTVYNDNALSIASEEVCDELIQGSPIITNASVINTSKTNGEVYLAWSKPTHLDFSEAPGPYVYRIYRSTDVFGINAELIDSLTSLNDTIYYDSGLNTADGIISYRVELHNVTPGNRFILGNPDVATTMYPNLNSYNSQVVLVTKKNVPWINSQYIVYRHDSTTTQYDSIGVSKTVQFIDTGVKVGMKYFYQVKSVGTTRAQGVIDPIINYSSENEIMLIDTFPPCAPVITVRSNCDSSFNAIEWFLSDTITDSEGKLVCVSSDIERLNLFYTDSYNGQFIEIGEFTLQQDNEFVHDLENESIAGCYYMTATDSSGNTSPPSGMVCVDGCSFFELPNVFSPNNDGVNDLFRPVSTELVTELSISIYDRRGKLVFKTEDIDINWNGKFLNTNKLVPPGVYFYVCDITENRLTGETISSLTGFIHVYTEKKAINNTTPSRYE